MRIENTIHHLNVKSFGCLLLTNERRVLTELTNERPALPDKAAEDDATKVRKVDPLLKLVPGQSRSLQVILVLDRLRSVSWRR